MLSTEPAYRERDGSALVPLALESYGARGKPAQRLLLKLADASEELSAQAFLLHASAALSVALQCGNADIAAHGTQALRMRQAAHACGRRRRRRCMRRTALAMSRLSDAIASSRRSHPASMTTVMISRWASLSTRRCWLPKQQPYALRLRPLSRARMLAALPRLALSRLVRKCHRLA